MKKKFKNINKIINNIIRILIMIIAIFMIYKKDYENLGVLVLTMILTFYDSIIKKTLKIELSENLKIVLTLFIFATQILGTVLNFYDKFLWWDTLLHGMSGIIFFFVGETLIKQINTKTSNADMSIIAIIIFSLAFSLATGTIWEIFEFIIDTTMGQNMQITEGLIGREAILDTMVDLIALTVGTIIITILQIYVNRKKLKEVFNNIKSK